MIPLEHNKENFLVGEQVIDSICTNKNCIRSFCRDCDHRIRNNVIQILNKYDDIFTCRNVKNLLSNETDLFYEPRDEHDLLDLFLYSVKVFYAKDIKKNFTKFATPHMRKNQVLKSMTSMNKPMKKRNSLQHSISDLDHRYCKVLYGQLLETNSYILVGVLQLFLHKFNKNPNFIFGLVIIRIFNIVCFSEGITDNDYNILYSVYSYVYQKISNQVLTQELQEPVKCDCGACLFHTNFSKADLVDSVATITKVLDSSSAMISMHDKKLKFLFEILHLMYKLNLNTKTISIENFYLNNIYKNINLSKELRLSKTNYDSPLHFLFTLPVQRKAALLKLENINSQQNSLQDSFFRALFVGMVEPFFDIEIRREFIYEDTISILLNKSPVDFKKQLRVKFKGEEGLDQGGVTKEFFQVLSEEIAKDTTLFVEKNNTLWLKPGANQKKLSVVGMILGMALYNNVILNIPFSSLLFKKFFIDEPEYEDLQMIEPEIYNSLEQLDKLSDEQIAELEIPFVAEYELNDKVITKDLIKDGSSTYVNKSNLHKFKELMNNFHTNDLISTEFNEVLDGLFGVINEECLNGFYYTELEKIIVGSVHIDFIEILKYTTFEGFNVQSPVIKYFKKVIEEIDEEEQKKLLKFITGNERLSIGGAQALDFKILRNGADTERLPSAQTCFNMLLLPEYSSYEKLKEKLLKAIDLTSGFYLR